jgi:sugar O-acyltransferase (sialic acid O-acetyltransferase NeuD family)
MKNELQQGVWIIGAGGHAKVVVAASQSMGLKVYGLFDGNSHLWGTNFCGIEISHMPKTDWWKDQCGILAIGSNIARKKISESIQPKTWATIIHPTALVHPTASIGEGSYIGAKAIIQPEARIGKHVIINTGAIIEHDVIIDSFCHIAPRTVLAGSVSVGEGTLIGVGSSVIPEVHIGSWSTVGAGAAVIKNIPSHSTAVGVPCNIIVNRSEKNHVSSS